MEANAPYNGPYEQLAPQLDKEGYLQLANIGGTTVRINMRRLIGHGLHGYVYPLERFDNRGQFFAAKILDKRLVKESHIANERQIHGTLQRSPRRYHPNIVQMQAYFEHQGIWAITIYEYMFGGTLEEYLHGRGLLPPWKVASYTKQLLTGVAFIHAQGYAHRDLKMPNLLLNETKTILKISDFGLACAHDPLKPRRSRCGTLPYMAPEVCLANYVPEGYDAQKADVWSVGVIVFYMLHGDFPWSIPDEAVPLEKRFWYVLFYEVLTSQALRCNLPRIGQWGLQLTLVLLQKDPKKRQTAGWLSVCKWLNEEAPGEPSRQPGA